MELKDILNLEEALFHPPVSFQGEWIFGDFDICDSFDNSYLILNSKKEGKKNKFLEYLEKYFYVALDKHLSLEGASRNFEPFIMFGENKDGRCITFSFSHFVVQNIYSLSKNSDYRTKFLELLSEETQSPEFLLGYLKDALVDERKKFYKVRDARKMKKSILNDEELHGYYEEIIDVMRLHEIDNMLFDEALEILISSHTKRIVACRYYLDFFTKEINTKELIDCFGFDTFCLLTAKSALDAMYMSDLRDNAVDNSSQFLYHYFKAVDELRKYNPNYNPRITVINPETKKEEKLTIEDIRKKFNMILAKHPSFSFVEYDVDQLLINSNFDMQSLSEMGKVEASRIIYDLFYAEEERRKILASWQILPAGEKTEEEKAKTGTGISGPVSATYVDIDESLRRSLIGHQFLENSKYLFKMFGINEFVGYNAYIFPSKKVILEWQPVEQGKRKRGRYNATYVMELYKFIELSKLSRQDLIRRITSDNDEDVKRIYHIKDMDKWKERVRGYISGVDYTDDTVNYINLLLSSSVVSKEDKKDGHQKLLKKDSE